MRILYFVVGIFKHCGSELSDSQQNIALIHSCLTCFNLLARNLTMLEMPLPIFDIALCAGKAPDIIQRASMQVSRKLHI